MESEGGPGIKRLIAVILVRQEIINARVNYEEAHRGSAWNRFWNISGVYIPATLQVS